MYDSLLSKDIGLKRSTLGFPGPGNVILKDLNNRPLIFPALTFPFRRGLVRHAKAAYEDAAKSSDSNSIALGSAPSPEEWDVLFSYCREQSPACSDCAFFND
jgi:hypothetical protein